MTTLVSLAPYAAWFGTPDQLFPGASGRMDHSADASPHINPRLIRLRDAPFYLGMDKNRFNAEVRPYVVEIRMGKQGVAFDRFDLDAWVDQYKARNGRPGQPRGDQLWDARERQDSTSAVASGTSTSRSGASAFAKALERATSQGRKSTSQRKRRKSGRQSSTE